MDKQHFEDFEVGHTVEVGEYSVEKDEIQAFAEQYDPQPFHIDEAAAAQSHFEGLIASGWHTAAMTLRMLVDDYFGEQGSLGSPGVDRLEWQHPVRPSDTLSLRVEVLKKTPLEDTDSRGIVSLDITALNPDDAQVLSMDANILFPRNTDK